MLKLGNVFLQHVNIFFFFFVSTHSHCELNFVLFFCFFFHQTAKTKQKNKLKKISPVPRLLSFIFCFVYFFIRNNHVCDGNFQW